MKIKFLAMIAFVAIILGTSFGSQSTTPPSSCLLDQTLATAQCYLNFPQSNFIESQCIEFTECRYEAECTFCDCEYDKVTQAQQYNQCKANAMNNRNARLARCYGMP